VMSSPGAVRIGIGVDREFAEKGVRVTTVSKGSVAAEMVLLPGDVLTQMNKTAIGGLDDLKKALSVLASGDKFHLEWMRGDRKHLMDWQFPKFTPSPTYARTKPTATLKVSSAGQRVVVEAHNVPSFRLWLSPVLFGEDPIVLAVNGTRVEPVVKVLTLEQICRRYAADADAGRVFTRVASVEIK
jgi:hypothetical protein